MLVMGIQHLAARDVPKPDRLVVTARKKALAVRRERHAADREGVAFEFLPFRATIELEQSQRSVLAAERHELAVGRERPGIGVELDVAESVAAGRADHLV